MYTNTPPVDASLVATTWLIHPGRCLQCLSMTLSLQNGAKIAWFRHWLLPQLQNQPQLRLLLELDIGVIKKEVQGPENGWIQRYPVIACYLYRFYDPKIS